MENFIFLCSDSSSEAFDKTGEGVNMALTWQTLSSGLLKKDLDFNRSIFFPLL